METAWQMIESERQILQTNIPRMDTVRNALTEEGRHIPDK